MRIATTLVLFATFLGGGGLASSAEEPPAAQDRPAEPQSAPATSEEAALQRRSRLQREKARSMPEAAPAGEQLAGTEVELPAALREAVAADAAAKAAVDPTTVVIKSARSVMWPDGSLGCPQPDAMYTQMLVPGYRILVIAKDQTYDYRATQKGTFQVCAPRLGVRHEPPRDDSTR